MDAVRISGVAVGDEHNWLVGSSRANGFTHGDGGWQCAARVGEVISSNLPTACRDKEKDIGVLTADFDVGFIAGAVVINLAFMGKVEAVAIISGRFGIVEHGLIRDDDAEDLPEHLRGFASTERKRDMESQNQADPMWRVMNLAKVHARGRWRGVLKMLLGIMMLAILIVQLEL